MSTLSLIFSKLLQETRSERKANEAGFCLSNNSYHMQDTNYNKSILPHKVLLYESMGVLRYLSSIAILIITWHQTMHIALVQRTIIKSTVIKFILLYKDEYAHMELSYARVPDQKIIVECKFIGLEETSQKNWDIHIN